MLLNSLLFFGLRGLLLLFNFCRKQASKFNQKIGAAHHDYDDYLYLDHYDHYCINSGFIYLT